MNKFDKVFFIGAGGIGMSALVRYFLSQNKKVSGYDKTSTHLTNELIDEGAELFFDDDINLIPKDFLNIRDCLIIKTPAVPKDSKLLRYFESHNFLIKKRAEILGEITRNKTNVCVAGTHGKTTISSMIASALFINKIPFTAFLGGIANNFNSNYYHNIDSEIAVIEADEYDRSFLQLSPDYLVVSALDPDHLDIYGTHENMIDSFKALIDQKVKKGGKVVIQHKLIPLLGEHLTSYSIDDKKADYYVENIKVKNHTFVADFVGPNSNVSSVQIGLPGIHNLENSLACYAILKEWGVPDVDIKKGIQDYKGVQRRFDVRINRADLVYIDDYAHHPEEITQLINSVRKLYPDQKICGVFQPHLYSRTKDFLMDFATALDLLDELVLLEIYPARELPIPGVNSKLLFDQLKKNSKILCSKKDALTYINDTKCNVVLSIGAGDIGAEVSKIESVLNSKTG